MDNNIKTIEEQNTIIDNNDNNNNNNNNNNKLICTLRAIWFRLLIDKKNEVNVFQIKRNKLIYCLTNIVIFLIYLMLTFAWVASITVEFSNVNENLRWQIIIASLVILVISLIFSSICSLPFYSLMYFVNIAYLVHSKYLADKYLYFYNIDLNHLIAKNIIDKKNLSRGCTKYLKEKDISELKIISNIKNFGIINKIFLKDKEKAIKLMKLSIKYFYSLTEIGFLYVLIPIVVLFSIISVNGHNILLFI